MHKLLVGCLFAWPLLALVIHMLINRTADRIRQVIQTTLVLLWLLLVLVLWLNTSTPEAIMMGSWAAPFGIALVSDQLSNTMLLVFAIVATCINFFSYQDEGMTNKKQAFYAGFWLLLLGICGALLTADIFNLYVWFEVTLVSAFILLVSGTKPKVSAMMHYAIMNIIGTLIMLLAVSLIYSAFGTLNYASIAQQLMGQGADQFLPIIALLLFAIGIKGAVFPLYFWLPRAYTKPSITATMLLSSLITKAVMVVLLRLAWLWAPLHQAFLSHCLAWVAFATMFFGVMGAASQFRFKDILAFHIISQLGYILLAIILPLPMAIVAAVFFLIHNIFVKTNLFMVAGILTQQVGTDDFKKLGSILKHYKWLSVAFFLSAMSLAGFPPLSGFWGKLLIIRSALDAHYYTGAVIAIVVSLFTLYSMIKIWRYVFCQPAQISQKNIVRPLLSSWCLIFAMLPVLILPIIIGVWPDSILPILHTIAEQVSDPRQYIYLVLGGG